MPLPALLSPPPPPTLQPRRWRRELPYMAAVALLAFALYAATASHTVLLQDDAIFIGALHFFGIPHPPGYPLYTLLGGAFYHLLPFGTPAYKAHLFSALLGAGAVAAVYAVAAMLLPGRLAALAAALAFATSKLLWSQAIIAEVYTLNAFLFFLLLALVLRAVSQQGRGVPWAVAVVCGLGLANHYPLFILAAAAVVLFGLLYWRDRWRAAAGAAAVAAATAAPFYLWMVWRSHHDMPYHFYGIAFNSWERFWYYVSRRGYAGVDSNPGVTWEDRLATGEFLAGEALAQFTLLGALLALAGFALLWRRHWVLSLSLLLSIFAVSPLLIVLRDAENTYIAHAIFSVYHITSYGIMAIALAAGIHGLAARAGGWRGVCAAGLAAAVVLANVATHWHGNNMRGYVWAQELATAKLESVDANAVLFVTGDLDFPVGYLRYVLGVRPDVTVLNFHGTVYGNIYRAHLASSGGLHHFVPDGEKIGILREFIADNEGRPILFLPRLAGYFEPAHGSDLLGFYRRLSGQPGAEVALSPVALEWVRHHLQNPVSQPDLWTRAQQRIAVFNVVSAALTAHWSGAPLSPAWQEVVAMAREQVLPVEVALLMHDLQTGKMDAAEMAAHADRCAAPAPALQEKITYDERMGVGSFAKWCEMLDAHRQAQE